MSDKEKGKYPFIMKPDGLAAIFGPGLNDGPFPEHYEPLECPLPNNLLSKQFTNPTIKIFTGELDKHLTCDPRFPFVATTYRVTEHWQTGIMTRFQPWLIEAQPQMFVEMSEELAKLRGIKDGEKAKVSSVRGTVDCVAIVTTRFRPFQIGNLTVHQVGMPGDGWITRRTAAKAQISYPNVEIPTP
jgi:formate dehydrogenase major subunit